MSWRAEFEREGEKFPVEATADGAGVRVVLGGEAHGVRVLSVAGASVRFAVGERTFVAQAVKAGDEMHVRLSGRTYRLPLHRGRRGGGAAAGNGEVVAPMTGTVQEIKVAVGDAVTADQTVAVVTAMKMEHKLAAGVDGTVTEVGPGAGTTVDQGVLLVRIEPAASTAD